MSKEYPYEVRDPQRSMEWTVVNGTFNAWASVRAFLKLKGHRPREFVDAPRVFEVRHPYTDPAAIHEVRVSVPLRVETDVRRHGAVRWMRVGRTAERDAERKAWARLAADGFVHAVEQRPDTLAAYDAARRDLQALGVDVDALLAEGPAS